MIRSALRGLIFYILIFTASAVAQVQIVKKGAREQYVCNPYKLSFATWSACQEFKDFGNEAKKCVCQKIKL